MAARNALGAVGGRGWALRTTGVLVVMLIAVLVTTLSRGGRAGAPALSLSVSPCSRSACPGSNVPLAAGGYWFVGADGRTFAFGAPDYGSLAGVGSSQPIVGVASTTDGAGYWLAARDGGVFGFGDAHFFGSAAGQHLGAPIVGMAVDPSTGGYWLAAADGRVLGFGAPSYGSMAGKRLNQPVVAMAATWDGGGYWLVARDGGVFSFGDARYHGSTGGIRLNQPIVGMAADAVSGGYWMVASDGGVFSFDAPFLGSMGATRLRQPIVGIGVTTGGSGYWMAASDGGVFSFGDARFRGSTGGVKLSQPIVAMAAVPVQRRLLVVGDSLIAQATTQLLERRPAGALVSAAGGVGSAPCDWVDGYRNPFYHGAFDSFSRELQLHHPQEVVIAFSGNPGFSGPNRGCVDATQPFSLDQLLASYQQSIIVLATQADDVGATVYLEASPARNPDDPAVNNYNGVPEINQLLLRLSDSPQGRAHHWHYDPTAGELLGGQPLLPAMTTMDWQLYLPCPVSPTDACVDGLTKVRAGDGIHLDPGAGATLEAEGVEHEPLATTLPPES